MTRAIGPDTVHGAAAVFTPVQRLGLLAGFTALVALRLPQAWPSGRFLGEEGAIFFAYGWHRPWAEALFRSFGGYLNMAANALTLLDARLVRAGVLRLEHAPYLTMVAALAVQLLPALLILIGRARWLASRVAVATALLGIATLPATEEVFLNVLHIQFHLALCVGLILAMEVPASRAARAAYGAVLFVAPLCGPGAIVLLPFVALRALLDRNMARLWQTVALAAGTAVQLIVFFRPSPVRGDLLDPATLAAVAFVRLIALPIAGFARANKVGRWIVASWEAGSTGWWLAVAAAVFAIALLLWAALRRRDAAAWLVLPALVLAAVSFGGGMIASDPRDLVSVGAGERYNFVPLVLLLIGLVAIARRPGGRWRWLAAVPCALALAAGAYRYTRPVAELARGPDWRAEVAAWRADPEHRLRTWPDFWTVDLSPQDRDCPPGRMANPHAPDYCESAWVALVAARTAAAGRGAR